MPDIPSRKIRDCCIAAQNGDINAMKMILEMFHYDEMANDIQAGRPISKRIKRVVDALTAGCGDPHWEEVQSDGSLVNLVWSDPLPHGKRPPDRYFDDD